jgi:hypothetical protein
MGCLVAAHFALAAFDRTQIFMIVVICTGNHENHDHLCSISTVFQAFNEKRNGRHKIASPFRKTSPIR